MAKQITFVVALTLLVAPALNGEDNSTSVEKRAKFMAQIPPGMMPHDYFTARLYGGELIKPGSGKGSVVIVNEQKRVPALKFDKVFREVANELKINIRIESAECPAEAVVKVVDSGDVPALTIYPEKNQAVVNVSPLAKDSSSDRQLADRVQKEILRAIAYIVGHASGSPCKGELLDAVTSLERLDAIKARLPGDILHRSKGFLERIGITPYVKVTYKIACEQGWAPPPTNEFQKAVWDKVHAIPDKPMKIQFDPATQKGKVTK